MITMTLTDSFGATVTASISVDDMRALLRCVDVGIDFYAGRMPKKIGGSPAAKAAEVADLLFRIID